MATVVDCPILRGREWLCPTTTNGKSLHLWSSHPWRSADWPSPSDLLLAVLVGFLLLMLSIQWSAGNFDCFSDQNFHTLKRVIHLRYPWESLVFLVFDATYYLDLSAENKHSFAWSCAQLHHPFWSPFHEHPLQLLTSTLWYNMQQWGSLPLSFHGDILGPFLWSSFLTASAIAQWPSCIVLTVTSTWASLLAQLVGPVKLNPMSLAPPKGSPSLCDCHPKNRTASLGASTTALFFETFLQHVHY